MTTLQSEIEKQLSACDPQIEVLLAEVLGGNVLRVFIDHPDGVTLQLCERVSSELSGLRAPVAVDILSSL